MKKRILIFSFLVVFLSGCAFSREMTMTVKADKVDHPAVTVDKGDVVYDSCTAFSFFVKKLKRCK